MPGRIAGEMPAPQNPDFAAKFIFFVPPARFVFGNVDHFLEMFFSRKYFPRASSISIRAFRNFFLTSFLFTRKSA